MYVWLPWVRFGAQIHERSNRLFCSGEGSPGQGFRVSRSCSWTSPADVGRNVLDVDRVREDDSRVLALGLVDGLARVTVGGEIVAGDAAALEGPVRICTHLIAVAGNLKENFTPYTYCLGFHIDLLG